MDDDDVLLLFHQVVSGFLASFVRHRELTQRHSSSLVTSQHARNARQQTPSGLSARWFCDVMSNAAPAGGKAMYVCVCASESVCVRVRVCVCVCAIVRVCV